MTDDDSIIRQAIRETLLAVTDPDRPLDLTIHHTRDPAGVRIISHDPSQPHQVQVSRHWVSSALWGHMVTEMMAALLPSTETPHDHPASGGKGAPCSPTGGPTGTEVEQGGASKSQTPESLEPAPGDTFAQSPVEGGGSTGNSHGASRTMENTGSERAKRGERAVDENHGAEDSMVCPRVAALAEAGDGSVYADRLGGGWWAIRSKGDPGSGMYRWILDEMPGTQLHRAAVFGGLGKATVDLFGADLTAARTLMAKYLGVELEDMMDRWPLAHRPTRLCRAARRARGEI